jgi:MinD-like ATPase involved in chromosome partitioning or flagellar assembly
MFIALTEIEKISAFLNDKLASHIIKNYRVGLGLDTEIDIILLLEEEHHVIVDELKRTFKNPNINIEVITETEAEADGFYQYLFSEHDNPNKVNLKFRRRYSSLIDAEIDREIKDYQPPCPVVTFYSYKGGMGRTTTLALFAGYYAMHHQKKVVIIDCDFEAPGITNFCDLDQALLAQKNGVVEYLLDKQFLGEKIKLQSYMIETSKNYSGQGKIYIIPAGNLSEDLIFPEENHSATHLQHYLEALSRLNLSGTAQIVAQFRDFLEDIQREIAPDVVLIDSRTGFNDIFANIGLSLSSLIIGFFQGNIQTEPGLHSFLNTVLKTKNYLPILVNSILPDEELFDNFELNTNRYIEKSLEGEPPHVKMFPILREPRLEKVGTVLENKKSFINLIKRPPQYDYELLFQEIADNLTYLSQTESHKVSRQTLQAKPEKTACHTQLEVLEGRVGEDDHIHQQTDIVNCSANKLIKLRTTILENLQNNYPELYGENIIKDEVDAAFLDHKFYFRTCMEDLFNRDKFLILGSKGTGKTFLYRVFDKKVFLKQLQERAGKYEDYEVINIISLKTEDNPYKYFEIATYFSKDEIKETDDFFFTRFWLIYVWNAILLDIAKLELDFQSRLEIKPITNDIETKERFLDYIHSDNKYKIVETELKEIDAALKQHKKNLLIAFDQLDFVVKPILWAKGIAPLINFWRSNRYSQIQPKLFVRSDLFEKLGNLTNKQSLKNRAILIEWTPEELFAFFFKTVFSISKTEFFELMVGYQNFAPHKIKTIQNQLDKSNQIPLESAYLKPLVETFFGKWADHKNTQKYGECYDWFYRNLKNADNTISLRPFLDLVGGGIADYFRPGNPYQHKYDQPILSPFYFSFPEVRKAAVDRHFKDLANEEGNGDLIKIFDYIRRDAPSSLRKDFLSKKEFDTLLGKVIETYREELDNRSLDDLRNLLEVNGIVSMSATPGGYTTYSFALLYKYYLGLRKKR